MKSRDLPVVRLNLVYPFLAELQRRGIECNAILATFGITPLAIQQGRLFVSVPAMYALAESLSECSGDPYFGVHVGESVNPWTYSPLKEAAETATTVGDFLLRFAMNVNIDTTSVSLVLEAAADRSTYYWRRVTDGGVRPAHNDGFDIAYLMKILQSAVTDSWAGEKVVVKVCEPTVIPPNYNNTRVAGTDALGASISFPSSWLILPPPSKYQAERVITQAAPVTPANGLVGTLHQVLMPYLQQANLNAEQIARLVGMSRRTLARQLQHGGTSLRTELAHLRQQRAQQLLRENKLSVAQVGAAVGYPEGAAFARAFRRRTGSSPKQYREQPLQEASQ